MKSQWQNSPPALTKFADSETIETVSKTTVKLAKNPASTDFSQQTTDTTTNRTVQPCGSKIQHVVGSEISRYANKGVRDLSRTAAAQTDRQTDRQTDNYHLKKPIVSTIQ